MNIYFACSITGGREYEQVYQAIVQALLADGHQVPTAHLAKPEVMALESSVEAADVFHRDINWIQESDALVAEVSTPSHGVGFEVCYALSLGKPVLCCYRVGEKISKMITGNPHPKLRLSAYRTHSEAVGFTRSFIADCLFGTRTG
ncbi:MAG TPA: nucleoside 2-deoxyribosyltransferase [Anaerolineales bacterium]|nr:nucleoside 2-deoxyribosyltransferase [Anaerolineales bacterium]